MRGFSCIWVFLPQVEGSILERAFLLPCSSLSCLWTFCPQPGRPRHRKSLLPCHPLCLFPLPSHEASPHLPDTTGIVRSLYRCSTSLRPSSFLSAIVLPFYWRPSLLSSSVSDVVCPFQTSRPDRFHSPFLCSYGTSLHHAGLVPPLGLGGHRGHDTDRRGTGRPCHPRLRILWLRQHHLG